MTNCVEIKNPCAPTPRVAEIWSICLPFGGRLWSDGTGVYAQGGTPPPDGVYGKVVIANGCLVGVEPEDVPLYTGSPCAPLPGDCSGSGSPGVPSGGGGGSGTTGGCCPPSSAAGNLYQLDATGKPLVKVNIRGGSGLTVTGSGTTSDPYVLSATGGGGIGVSGVYLRSANDAIAVTGSGSRENPLVIEHQLGLQTSKNGMTFDQYGHLVNVTEGSVGSGGVSAIIGGSGIDAETDLTTGVTTIKLQKSPNAIMGKYPIGGYDMEFDENGRLFNIVPTVDLGSDQVLHLNGYDVTVNSHGTITKIDTVDSGGICYVLGWAGANGEIHHRWGEFYLRNPTAIAGQIWTYGTELFWAGLAVYIDGVVVQATTQGFLLKIKQPWEDMQEGLEEYPHIDKEFNIASTKNFYSNGILLEGTHRLDIFALGEPWPAEIGAGVHMWPATIAVNSNQE